MTTRRTSRCVRLSLFFARNSVAARAHACERVTQAQINLAVVLLYSPKLDEVRPLSFLVSRPCFSLTLLAPRRDPSQAISHLHTLLRSSSPSVSLAAHHSPALLSNLCTLYELRSERATEDKVRLLVAAASCGGGAQGVEASSFKLAL